MPRLTGGSSRSDTSDVNTRARAAPVITPTASASAFCFSRNSRNSRTISPPLFTERSRFYGRSVLFGDGNLRRIRLLVEGHLAQHLRADREDEREAVVALHPADGDADEHAALVEDAAARHARMAVGQAGDETVGGALADIAGREDDALRVVVAEPEDRIREVVRERRVDVQRGGIEDARLDDGPVPAVDFRFGVAGVHHFGGDLLAAVDDLHRSDLPRALAVFLVLERHHGVLHGAEVSMAQIAVGAAARFA